MTIKAIGFDLDDTLYSRTDVMRKCFNIMEEEIVETNVSEEDFIDIFTSVSQEQYERLMDGKISEDKYEYERIYQIYQEMDFTLSDEDVQFFIDLYKNQKEDIELRPVFKRILEQLQGSNKLLFILTNGTNNNQLNKIKRLALEEKFGFSTIFTSEGIGASKPEAEVFQYIEQALSLEADEILYVGDNLEMDYRGAKEAGWHSILVDLEGRYADLEGVDVVTEEERLCERVLNS